MDATTLAKIKAGLKETEAKLAEMRSDIHNAKMAGIDISGMEKRYDDLNARYSQMVKVYGR
jgi:hypothetical protein